MLALQQVHQLHRQEINENKLIIQLIIPYKKQRKPPQKYPFQVTTNITSISTVNIYSSEINLFLNASMQRTILPADAHLAMTIHIKSLGYRATVDGTAHWCVGSATGNTSNVQGLPVRMK
jgi:hypothetical protein